MYRFVNFSSRRICSSSLTLGNPIGYYRCLTTRLHVATNPSTSERFAPIPSKESSTKTVNVKKLFSKKELESLVPTIKTIPLSKTIDFKEEKRSKRQHGKRSINSKTKTTDRKTVEDLIQIFDQAVPHVEFAFELQKMNETMSLNTINSNERQKIESQIVNYLGKFSDQELLVVIQFLKKFYSIDNEFTRQFSSSFINRSRQISPQHIVRLLEELTTIRCRTQWIHSIQQHLSSQAQIRSSEFENIRDILSICSKLSDDDRLIDRFDERLLDISDHLSFDDWFSILHHKSTSKRRDRTMIRAAFHHLTKLSDGTLISLEKIKDCLAASSKLNIPDRNFLERLINDAFVQIHQLENPSILPSLITSMGTLRLRHCDLLNSIGKLLIDRTSKMSSKRLKSIHSFILTCASVQYSPPTLSTLINEYSLLNEENSSTKDLKNQLDFVWSLAILGEAKNEHLSTILNNETFQTIQNEISNSKIGNALKVLALYSYSLQNSTIRFVPPTFELNALIEQITRKNSDAQNQLTKIIKSFARENHFSKFNVFTSNLILIDCLMIVDRFGVPQDLTKSFLCNDESTNRLNKISLDENCSKIVLKCLSYQDKTLITDSISGPVNFQVKLLNSLGYKCVLFHWDEFVKIQRFDDRVKFIQRLIREAIR